MAYPQYDPRDDVTAQLMKDRGASTFDYGLAGLGSAQRPMASMTAGPQLEGLPVTPAGGVPGSGLATAPQSTVALPPQRTGMRGAMPMMGGLGMGQAPGMGGMQQMAARRPSPTPRGAPGPIMPPLPWQPPDMT